MLYSYTYWKNRTLSICLVRLLIIRKVRTHWKQELPNYQHYNLTFITSRKYREGLLASYSNQQIAYHTERLMRIPITGMLLRNNLIVFHLQLMTTDKIFVTTVTKTFISGVSVVILKELVRTLEFCVVIIFLLVRCLTCSFRASCCRARLSRAHWPSPVPLSGTGGGNKGGPPELAGTREYKQSDRGR